MTATPQLERTRPARAARRILPSPVTGQEWVLVAILVVLWLVLSFTTPAFATAGSWQPLLASVAPVALMGVGMTMIIITGGIDVSVGGAMMVTGVTTAKLLVDQGVSLIVALAVRDGARVRSSAWSTACSSPTATSTRSSSRSVPPTSSSSSGGRSSAARRSTGSPARSTSSAAARADAPSASRTASC